ncbi:MAG: XRE family transcriptional regulator [Eubacteriales bacterium]|nr:XRE family transcriptional regulator [Eubacteriales bacterium]
MLGDHIRNLRKEKHITLSVLAEATDLSAGYLSQIERGVVDPSLSSLHKIANALDVPPMLLLDDPFSRNLTLHREEQPIVTPQESTTVQYRMMTTLPSNEYMPGSLVLEYTIAPHSQDFERPINHNTEEFIVVLTGAVTAIVDTQTVFLREGDTTIIRKNVSHVIRNDGDAPATGLSIMTPAIWSLRFS